MDQEPPRRWWTFSLRTMFVIVTVLCCWLGWESHIVRQRRIALQDLSSRPSIQITTAKQSITTLPPGVKTRPGVSFVRRLLGDEAIYEIGYSAHLQSLTEADRNRLARIFPEARIHQVEFDRGDDRMLPCHPGCFPRGTLVDSPRGPRLIESLKARDVVTIIDARGDAYSGTVTSVFVTTNILWKVRTEAGILLTTKIQPLCLANGKILPAGELQPGDLVLHREGDEVHSVRVLGVSSTERAAQVFNVVLGDSEIFVAGGYLARSKPPLEIAARP